jgi:hypothetical protein
MKHLCYGCHNEFSGYGALIISPPGNDAPRAEQSVIKKHLCRACYALVLQLFSPDYTELHQKIVELLKRREGKSPSA